MGPRPPKPWCLTRKETISSFDVWRNNLVYCLSLDANFSPFLAENCVWLKKSTANPLRGFTNDPNTVPEANRRTAIQKDAHCDMMLRLISNYCPVLTPNTIVKASTSLKALWQKIREHYGFQLSGSHFLDLAEISFQTDESHEDLFQRLTAFYEDNLLYANGPITHHGETITSDEDLTPTLENSIVVQWLGLIHPGLPKIVKQRYGPELRNKTIASIKPEISQAIPSLLEELRAVEDTSALRAATFNPQFKKRTSTPRPFQSKTAQANRDMSCTLCKASGRPHANHYLSTCKFLPDADRRAIVRARLIGDDNDSADVVQEDDSYDSFEVNESPSDNALLDDVARMSARRVKVIQSPYLDVFHEHFPVHLTLDTGATTNMVSASFARSIGLPMKRASQVAHQADGVTPLKVVGEVHCTLSRDSHSFQLDGLVVEQLDVDVLAGNPFLDLNDVAVRVAKKQIVINGHDVLYYGGHAKETASVRRTQSYLLRSPPRQSVILPGEYLEISTPSDVDPDAIWALEPRFDTHINKFTKPERAWPTVQEVKSIGGHIRIPNMSDDPIVVRKSEHLCQIRQVLPVSRSQPKDVTPSPPAVTNVPTSTPDASGVSIDPDNILPDDVKQQFRDLHKQYEDVFTPVIHKYNGASGNIKAVVNIGPTLPPQRKGRLPHYNKETMNDLQNKFDELEASGVFAKPEDLGITVEYLNLSFLVKKPNGGHRLVTSFGEIGKYSKPQPSLMPNIDNVLREIGQWKYIIVTDLLKSFYQIPLSKGSMKFCGVSTPFKGIRVYTRAAMGMPGSETCLEELMSRVVGNLIQEGCVAKIADDMYIGGNTPHELLHNWSRVLDLFKCNNLGISASKTIVCPMSTTILGWIWCCGTLKASPHRVAALAAVKPPTTVQGLRSFIGAYKVLSRVLNGYSSLLDPLDQLCAGKQSKDKLIWSDYSLAAFTTAQSALKNCKEICIPRAEDILWIVTDGSVKCKGISAALYVLRNTTLHLAGFFNAKLRKHQVTWLPCEIEALGICAAVRHFSPYIIQSHHTTQVLTDNRPCIQAYDKLRRGEFSTSSRVTSFLSTISRYQVQVRHIAGVSNLPADFGSRNPSVCPTLNCQVCSFVRETEDSVVRGLSVADVCEGSASMPFTSHNAWLATQRDCHDLRRTYAYLSQGTRPTKKETNIHDIKRYLKAVTIANDGLLVVKVDKPFLPTRQLVVIPRAVLDGLLTALHIRFSHPTLFQLKKVFTRYFFALDIDRALHDVTEACHHCASLRKIPTHLHPQSSEPPPDAIGSSFAADVMRRYKQYVMVLRETVSSYTLTMLVDNEKRDTLRDALLILCSEVRSLGSEGSHIRVDPAPGLVSLTKDPVLKRNGISLVIGNVKNVNKNPVAEKAIMELGLECLNLYPEGGPLTKVTLALATANMNCRIRHGGLSAREVWTQRDQVTGEQLPLVDKQLISLQNNSRIQNHPASAKSKAHGKTSTPCPDLQLGDIVYLYGDRDKTKVRDRYMVTAKSDLSCQVRKFTKNQFRSKVYDVPLSNCYKVPPSTLAQSTPGPIRGLEPQHNQDLDNVIHAPPVTPSTDDVDGAPPLPPAIIEPLDDYITPPAEPLSPQPSFNVHEDDLIVPQHIGSETEPRRSGRIRKFPSHFKDFVIDGD